MQNDNQYKLKNGTIVNINDLSNLSEQERQELFDTPLNKYEGLHIKNDLEEIKTSLSETLSFIRSHNSKCPVAEESINEMINNRMKTNIKETILTSGNIAKAITTIFFLVLGLGTLFFVIADKFK
jgi:hypothetical protein